jgi:hypothetical protein
MLVGKAIVVPNNLVKTLVKNLPTKILAIAPSSQHQRVILYNNGVLLR